MNVEDLHTGSEYTFRVTAHNAAGDGKPSDASVAKTAKPPYGKIQYHLPFKEGYPFTVQCLTPKDQFS